MTTKKMSLDEVRDYMEQAGIESFGEAGFGDEYVAALKNLGVTDSDEIEIFESDWRGIISEETGSGKVNGRTFGEDGNNCELVLYWLDEYFDMETEEK